MKVKVCKVQSHIMYTPSVAKSDVSDKLYPIDNQQNKIIFYSIVSGASTRPSLFQSGKKVYFMYLKNENCLVQKEINIVYIYNKIRYPY